MVYLLKRLQVVTIGIMGMAALLFSMLLWAATPAQQLTQHLGNYSSLQADFVQYLLDASGSRLQETSVQMKLLQPNKFYWQTEDPFAQTIASNGQEVWIYDPDLEQVTVQILDTRVTATPALLLSGDQQMIAEHFEVQLNIGSDGMQQFVLVPKDPESLYESIKLYILDGQLKQMQLVDTLQQKTAMNFFNLVQGAAIPEQVFQFQIPADTDLIDMR